MIAVTGASGFLGTAVLNEMTNAGQIGFGAVRRTLPVASPHHLAQLDLSSDAAGLRTKLDELGATVLIHLALVAKTDFDRSPELAKSGVELIDRTVIEACRKSPNLRLVVLVGSAAVYGDLYRPGQLIREDANPAPRSGYGRIKLEQEVRWAAAKLRCSLVTARVFNMIGPNEPTSLVASSVAERLSGLNVGGALPIRSSESTRDFCDVRDVATALLSIAAPGAACPPVINVCTGIGTTIRTLTQMMVKTSGRRVVLEPDGTGEESRSVGNSEALRSLTGWRRRFSLQDSVLVVWSEHSQRIT